jgi:dephospho-CoA kinase
MGQETKREMAARHVMSAKRIIANQKSLIERLRLAGLATDNSEALLDQFERTLQLFEEDLHRIEAER